MDMRTPLNRVRYLGAAHAGTSLFNRQRLTALANIPLTLFVVWLAATSFQVSRAELIGLFGNPIVAGLCILFLISVSIHMRIGVQEVIEDYIHTEMTKKALLIANTFFALLVLALGVVSVLKLSFGG